MAEKTTNYGLTKPNIEDFYDVNVQNENMDKIDYHLAPLIVTFSGTTEEDYAVDKTFDEIKQAWDDNRRILMIERQRNYPYIYYPALISDSDAVFVRLYENNAATIIFSKYDYIAKEEYSFLTEDHATDTNAHNDIRIIAENAATLANNINEALKNKANANHSHSATDITKDTLSHSVLPTINISKGGTGATTAADARTNLGITPANIGAASNANPKFTGGVTLNEIVGLVVNADGIAELTIKHKTEQGNSRKLYVAPSDAVEDLEMAILLGDESRGLTRLYKLYGEHNTTVETWTFTLEDGSTVTKAVYVG